MNDRLHRLLLLVPAVLAEQGLRIQELAQKLDTDVAKLREDIDLLACIGAPPFEPDDLIEIEVVADRVYVRLPQSFSRPARLTATEAAALAAAARGLAPHDPSVGSAVEKLAQAVSPLQKGLYEGLLARFAVDAPEVTADVARVLTEAARARKTTEILYFAGSEGAARPREVKPRTIASTNGIAYLSAQNDRGEERLYRLDRIVRATPTERTFDALPAHDLKTQLAQIARFHEGHGLPRATLRFAASVAAAARARHPDARNVEAGRVEADVPYASLPWLVSYVLSWGGASVVLAPDEARRAVLDAVGRAQAT